MSTAVDVEAELRVRIKDFLHNIAGDPKPCRGCQVPTYWVVHRNGKRVPYTEQGINHFADCIKANDFRRDHATTAKPDRRYVPTTLRYDGVCRGCEAPLAKGDQAIFDTDKRQIYCSQCKEVLEGQ